MSSRLDPPPWHPFEARRAAAALVTHDPDRTPFRATTAAALVGLLLTVVAVAGTTAWSLRVDGAARGVMVEQEGKP